MALKNLLRKKKRQETIHKVTKPNNELEQKKNKT